MKIPSKYNYNNYYLVNNFRNNSGIVLEINKNKRNLLTQEEYFNIENTISANNYKTVFERELYYSISSINYILNNIFGIGTKSMIKILYKHAKRNQEAKILKLLYQFEYLKLYDNGDNRSIFKILAELNKFNNIKIRVNKINNFNTFVEYLIDYDGYLFSICMTHNPSILNLPVFGKQVYIIDNSSISKVFDLIYDRFGKYMK